MAATIFSSSSAPCGLSSARRSWHFSRAEGACLENGVDRARREPTCLRFDRVSSILGDEESHRTSVSYSLAFNLSGGPRTGIELCNIPYPVGVPSDYPLRGFFPPVPQYGVCLKSLPPRAPSKVVAYMFALLLVLCVVAL